MEIARETSPYYTNIQAIASPVVDISLDEPFIIASITLTYDPAKHSDYQNLGIFTYDKNLGTFVQVPSTVDPVKHTLTAKIDHFSMYTILHIPTWKSLFSRPMM